MKKFLSFMLSGLALFALFGCGGGGEPEKQPPEEQQQPPVVEEDPPTPVYEDWAEDGELSILAIGNSFSGNTLEYAHKIATGYGIGKVTLGDLAIGGCSVDMHYVNAMTNSASYLFSFNDSGKWNYGQIRNATLEEGLRYREWDYISLQPGTGDGSRLTVAGSLSNLDKLVEYVRSVVGEKPRIVWNMFWSDDDPSKIPDFLAFGGDNAAEFEAIAKVTKEVVFPKPAFSLVSPTGTAIQNVRTSFIGKERQLTEVADGHHLAVLGRYIAAYAYISALTGKTPAEQKYKLEGLNDMEFSAIAECVTNALLHPYEITPSIFR